MKMKPGLPRTPSKIAIYLAKQIDALQGVKSQREIAAEMGYERANIVSMFKTGEVKVPLEKIPDMAKALKVDPAFLFRLAMEQYWPDRHDAIGAIFGSVTTVNQRALLKRISELTGEDDPEPTPELDKRLTKAFGVHVR